MLLDCLWRLILPTSEFNGSPKLLVEIAEHVDGHALSLQLLAQALAWGYEGVASAFRGVILNRAIPEAPFPINDHGVAMSYLKWLKNSPAMELLSLTGFFFKPHVSRAEIEDLICFDAIRPTIQNLYALVVSENGNLKSEGFNELLLLLTEAGLLLQSHSLNDPARCAH